MDLKTFYREVILDHYKKPRNSAELPEPDRVSQCKNPSCGDRVTLQLKVDDGVISEVGLIGNGCAISQASASLLTDEIKGRPLAEVEEMKNQDILDLLGIEISPARLKCALLSVDTLHRALDGREGGQTTPEISGVGA